MCTSLLYRDLAGLIYAGRTLELPVELPYFAAFLPKGTPLASQVQGQPALNWRSDHDILGVIVPVGGMKDIKVVEGINEAGLNFSLLAFAGPDGPRQPKGADAPLSSIDLGAWALSRFATVAEVKAALAEISVVTDPHPLLGGAVPPFHYTVHDASGASIVIEFTKGEMQVHDNPIGVMTNSPSFDWHMTNLANYTFLDNVDQTVANFLGQNFEQPDSGIATVALPSSDTAVGRFVRAVYYANFAEKADGPEAAILALSHIMNKFDRPKGASLYSKTSALTQAAGKMTPGGEAKVTAGPGEAPKMVTEYTSWITLIDLQSKAIWLRLYDSLNYMRLDFDALQARATGPLIAPLEKLSAAAGDASAVMSPPPASA